MKRKAIFTVSAVVCAISVLFSGCGAKKTSNSGGVTTVTVWSSDGSGKSTWEALVKKFNETTGKEKGVSIEWVTYGGSELSTVVDVAQKNGQLPELCNLTANQEKKFILSGDIIPIEDLDGGKEFIDE